MFITGITVLILLLAFVGYGGLAIYIFNSATDYPGSTPYAIGSVSVNFTNGNGGSIAFTAN